MSVKEYIDSLVAGGRYFFTFEEVQRKFDLSKKAAWALLRRLKAKKEIVSPTHGYYLIIPREYRNLGTLPPEQFIHDLMKHLDVPYYVGLLSAAQRYGAAHQQPQVFQVLVPKSRREMKAGRVSVSFIMKKHLKETPTRQFNTPKGVVFFSSPEATCFDLVAFSSHCGGLGNVLTVISELVEQMTVDSFKAVLSIENKFSVTQRLGYLFELAGTKEFVDATEEFLIPRYLSETILDVRNPSRKGEIHKRWKLLINTILESDL